jgi:hypothetical protein
MSAEINLNAVYVPSQDMVAREIEGKLIILPLITGVGNAESELFALSETGQCLWQLLDGKRTLKKIIETMHAEYDAPRTEIDKDIKELIRELLQRRIIIEKYMPGIGTPEPQEKKIPLSTPVILELLTAVHEKGSCFRFRAHGYSMKTAIKDNDIITLSPLSQRRPIRGEVVAFHHPDHSQLLVHRVLRTRKNLCYIQGDNYAEADGWIPETHIKGIVTRVERKGKVVFWPDRNQVWARLYFRFYSFWPPARRLLARGYRFLKKDRRGRLKSVS